jgi:hypothetical protein
MTRRQQRRLARPRPGPPPRVRGTLRIQAEPGKLRQFSIPVQQARRVRRRDPAHLLQVRRARHRRGNPLEHSDMPGGPDPDPAVPALSSRQSLRDTIGASGAGAWPLRPGSGLGARQDAGYGQWLARPGWGGPGGPWLMCTSPATWPNAIPPPSAFASTFPVNTVDPGPAVIRSGRMHHPSGPPPSAPASPAGGSGH